jgi:hypothetical protein
VQRHLGVEHGVVVGLERLPVFDRLVPQFALRRVRAPLEVCEGRLVGGDHAGARTRFDAHVADRHARVHRKVLDGLAAVLEHVALAAAGADLRDDRQDDVFGAHVFGQVALDVDGHGLERLEAQRLRGHHMLHFGGADAERERAERAMGRGV